MHINTKRSISKKKIALIVAGIVLVAAGILAYTETQHITNIIKNPFYKPAKTKSVTEQKEAETKSDPTTSPPKSQPTEGVNKSQTTDDVPVTKTTSLSITQLNQSNGNVNLTTSITNPASSGTCTFTFTSQGTKPVVSQASTTGDTCSTSIPDYQFSMIGDWQVKVNYFANDTITTTTGSITIQ
jgi:cytoskeletal protein RodZ